MKIWTPPVEEHVLSLSLTAEDKGLWMVYVNGVLQSTADYSVSKSGIVTFNREFKASPTLAFTTRLDTQKFL